MSDFGDFPATDALLLRLNSVADDPACDIYAEDVGGVVRLDVVIPTEKLESLLRLLCAPDPNNEGEKL